MMDSAWGWSTWGCDWHGGVVVYNHSAFYGNAAWHGAYYHGGYHAGGYGYHNCLQPDVLQPDVREPVRQRQHARRREQLGAQHRTRRCILQ